MAISSKTTIGELVVLIGADNKDLKDKVNESETRIKSLGSVAAKVTGILAGLGAVAGLVALVKSSSAAIDEQSKLAARLGGTVKGLQALQYAGDLAGISNEALGSVMERLQARMGEASRTMSGPAYEALKSLKLEAASFAKLDLDERVALLAQRFKDLGFSTDQQAATLRNLGIRSQELITLMEDGGDSIRQARKDIEDFGIGLSNIDARKVEIMNDAWTITGMVIKGIGNQLTVALAPALTLIARKISDASRESGGFKELIKSAVESVIVGVAGAIDSLRSWAIWLDEVKNRYQLLRDIASIGFDFDNGAKLRAEAWERYEKRAKELKEQAAAPPSYVPALEAFRKFTSEMEQEAKEADDRVKERMGKRAQLDPYTAEQRKAFQERLAALEQSLANEDVALKLSRDKQIKDIEEFEKNKTITTAKGNELRLQAEAKYQDALAQLKRSKIEDSLMTENERLAADYADKLKAIQEFEASKTYTVQEAEEMRRKLVEQNALRMHQINASYWSRAASVIDSSMNDIASAMGSGGKKQFGILKAISMATALMKGYEAVVGAYAAGANIGGPPVGAAFAALAAAATAAQIARIASTNIGSKGVPTAGGGGGKGKGAVIEQQQQQSQTMQHSLHVTGLSRSQLFNGDGVREVAEALLDYQRNGGKVVFSQ